jgi:hypothetical protein
LDCSQANPPERFRNSFSGGVSVDYSRNWRTSNDQAIKRRVVSPGH